MDMIVTYEPSNLHGINEFIIDRVNAKVPKVIFTVSAYDPLTWQMSMFFQGKKKRYKEWKKVVKKSLKRCKVSKITFGIPR
jgi:hypothetical protein